MKKNYEKNIKNEYDNFNNGKDINTKRIKSIITHNFYFIINFLYYIKFTSRKYTKIF